MNNGDVVNLSVCNDKTGFQSKAQWAQTLTSSALHHLPVLYMDRGECVCRLNDRGIEKQLLRGEKEERRKNKTN